MMDGITVLNVIEHEVTGWGWNIFALLPLIFGVILVLIAFVTIDDPEVWTGGVLVLGAIFILLGVMILQSAKVVSTYNTYEVTIDDTVNWVELNNKYEVLSQRGNIIEIKERGIE